MEFITNMQASDWIIVYFFWTLVGFYLLFILNLDGIHSRLNKHERKGYLPQLVIATCFVILFWPISRLIVSAFECWVLKREYKEWKKNLKF